MAQVKTKTVLSFSKETPMWAKWTFRIVFAVTTVAAFVIAADPAINAEAKVRIGVYLKGLDMLVYLISKGFGVQRYDRDIK